MAWKCGKRKHQPRTVRVQCAGVYLLKITRAFTPQKLKLCALCATLQTFRACCAREPSIQTHPTLINLSTPLQLWDPYPSKGTQSTGSCTKFACKVCLKKWDPEYERMLQLLDLISSLSVSEPCIMWSPTNRSIKYFQLIQPEPDKAEELLLLGSSIHHTEW